MCLLAMHRCSVRVVVSLFQIAFVFRCTFVWLSVIPRRVRTRGWRRRVVDNAVLKTASLTRNVETQHKPHFSSVLTVIIWKIVPVCATIFIRSNDATYGNRARDYPSCCRYRAAAAPANMTNNVLGSGLVALAYAVSRVGTNLWLHRSARSSPASSF